MSQSATALASKFIVQDLFPRNEIHLISGSLSVGKTTLALQWYDDFMHGRDILGHKSYPAAGCYVTCNRSRNHIRNRMDDLAIPLDLPHLSLVENASHDEFMLECAYKFAAAIVPHLRVLFLDGIQSLIAGNPNDTRCMDAFMVNAQRFCRSHELTIIGIAFASKSKEGAGYENVLERTAGATSLVGQADTRINLDRWSKDLTDPHRKLTICTARRATRLVWARFGEDGRLDLTASAPEAPEDTQLRGVLSQWLLVRPESTFTTSDLLSLLDGLNVSRRTLFRWLEEQCNLGTIQRIEKGEYRILGREEQAQKIN